MNASAPAFTSESAFASVSAFVSVSAGPAGTRLDAASGGCPHTRSMRS